MEYSCQEQYDHQLHKDWKDVNKRHIYPRIPKIQRYDVPEEHNYVYVADVVRCKTCGTVVDRDVNASENILDKKVCSPWIAS